MNSQLGLSDLDEVMRHDLMTFIHRCFVELNPQQTLSEAPHLIVIAAQLADTLLGRGPRRLAICLPPRSLKSLSVSVAAVAWILGLAPTKSIICVSYGQDLADKLARDTRTIMTSPFYRRLFPATVLSKNSANDFETTKQGFRMATSVGGVLTGRGGDILILDDPLKPADALSETQRTAVQEWYDNTLISRLNNKETGIVIVVMQRLHQDDLLSYLLERGEEWKFLSFPAIAETDESYIVQTALGPFHYERKVGEVLDSSRESLETLLAMKGLINSYNFEAQYQQNPTPIGGNIVKNDWLQYYDPAAPLPRFTTKLQSWDTANMRELTGFPGGKFDDQVDSTTQALDYMSRNNSMEVWKKLGSQP